MDETARLRQEVEFLRKLVEAQNETIAELLKQRTAAWPVAALPSIPAPTFEPCVDGLGHVYPSAWWGIAPPPCEKCHKALPVMAPTISWCADPAHATQTATVITTGCIVGNTTGCATQMPEIVIGGPQRTPSGMRFGSTH